jgi:hypothetical protein
MLHNQQRPKDLSLIMASTKSIFNILYSMNILASNVQKSYTSKLALLVIKLINNYNHNINRVDIVD